MWWSRLILVMGVLALGPAGCGFRPLYGQPDGTPQSPTSADLAQIRVAGIADRTGQLLRTQLVHRLSPQGEPANPRFVLDVEVAEDLSGIAESNDGKTTIGRMTLRARYILRDAISGKPVTQAESRSYGTFRYLGPRYGSVVSERSTEESALSEIAADIAGALAVTMNKLRDNR